MYVYIVYTTIGRVGYKTVLAMGKSEGTGKGFSRTECKRRRGKMSVAFNNYYCRRSSPLYHRTRARVCVVGTHVPKVERVERFDKREKLLADSLFGTIKTTIIPLRRAFNISIRNFLPMNV